MDEVNSGYMLYALLVVITLLMILLIRLVFAYRQRQKARMRNSYVKLMGSSCRHPQIRPGVPITLCDSLRSATGCP